MSLGLPECIVDVYPYEGGQFTLIAGQGLRSCRTRQRIGDINAGTFDITLAPGGPFGPDADPQWVDIIRPMSLVVISMQRLGRVRIVMIGLVRDVWESETWQANQGVQRECHIGGRDFGYLFSLQNFYGQLLFQFTSGALIGTPDSTVVSALNLGLASATLQESAIAWYTKIMAGTDGLMSKTNFAYQGSRVKFDDIMTTVFGIYPDLKLQVATAVNFAVMSGTWYDTFTELYAFPWFEVFITTAEAGFYGQPAAKAPLTSTHFGAPPASPCLIARANPIPTLHDANGPPFSIDMSMWEALPVYELDTIQGISRMISFNEAEAKNLYAIVPRYMAAMFSNTNDSNTTWLQQVGVWFDTASLQRYGYRPFVSNPNWFADPYGDGAKRNQQKGGQAAYIDVGRELGLKAASHFEPLPLMGSGAVMTNLRPDIQMGTRFRGSLSKAQEMWEFYIEGVEHNFVFGGSSLTTLHLTRGLPLAAYQDENFMKAVCSGNVMRQDGQYKIGLQEGALAPLKIYNLQSAAAISSQISAVWSTPGKK